MLWAMAAGKRGVIPKERGKMKQKWTNEVDIQGYVFSFGDGSKRGLHKAVTGPNSKNPGTEYIQGEISIATDEAATNVVNVYYSYVTKTFPAKNGKPERSNPIYETLFDILEENNTYEKHGKEAQKVRISGELEVNDFYNRDDELVTTKRIRGGFIHTLPTNATIGKAPKFTLECVLTGCKDKEVENADDYVILSGYAFNFRNDLLPFEVNVFNEGGQNYFRGLDIDKKNPVATKIWGEIISRTVKMEKTIENAFGEPTVETTERSIRSWTVIGASPETMEYGDEDVITNKDMKKLVSERNERLAIEKKRQEDYRANQDSDAFATTAPKGKVTHTSQGDETEDDDFPF